MSRTIKIAEGEIPTSDDFTAIGRFASEADEAIVGGALAYQAHWSNFSVAQTATDQIEISAGEYFEGSKVFSHLSKTVKDLQSFKPRINNDERWLAIILRGTEQVEEQARFFETSDHPLVESVPVSQNTPKVDLRSVDILIQQGEIAPPPANRPTVAENDCCIAFVLLNKDGIAEIVANDADRIKPLAEVEGRLVDIEVKVSTLFEQTEAITTDLANVAASIQNVPSSVIFAQMVRDTARMRQALNFPDEARNYYFDEGLTKDLWDLNHLDSAFRVNEGLRHPYASQSETTLRLFDPSDPLLMARDNVYVPEHDLVARITSPVGGGSQDLSSVVHSITTATQHTVAHERIRYGETVTRCENAAGWGEIAEKKADEVFAVDGEKFVSLGKLDTVWNRSAEVTDGHYTYGARKVLRDTYYSSYTTYHTEEFGLTGARYGNTFLNAQIMVCAGIDLNFTRVGGSGDVTLCVCKTTASGEPDYNAVIARVTKPHSELNMGWCRFDLPYTLLDQGQQFAWFVNTTGNHAISTNTGNSFAGGTMFIDTDGKWAQPQIKDDFAFRIIACKFKRSRTVVNMESVSLDGGMTEFTMTFKGWVPAGAVRWWEVRAQGSDEWVPLDDRDPNALASMPPLVQLRMVMIGTQDIAPAIVLDNKARILVGRMSPNMKAIGNELVFDVPTNQLQLVSYVDYFDDDRHSVAAIIRVDDTEVLADAVTVERDIRKDTRVKVVANFTLGTPANSARVQMETSTDNVKVVPFVQDIQLNAF